MKKYFYILSFFALIYSVPAQKAFPDAHGFGRFATGGKGGSVIYVTNTNNSGTGSLREALTASGARTILFKVSGTINLTSSITIDNGNLTIAGESAPGQGVQIVYGSGAYIQIRASNIIIRHIRFRGGSGASQSQLRFIAESADMENIIIDHCSFAWAITTEMTVAFEKSTGSYQISNATVSNCLVGEVNRGMLQYKGHWDISYYRNYFYGVWQRAPTSNYPFYQDASTLSFEVINQIWHNMFHFPVEVGLGTRFTVIGSKRRNVSGTANGSATGLISTNGGGDGTAGDTYIYQTDNINEIGSIYSGSAGSYDKATPYYSSDIIGSLVMDVDNIDTMLPMLGAFWWDRDSHDQRFINYYINDNGSQGTYTGTPDTLDGGTAYTDSDNDGMDDAWEITEFGNLSKGNNGFDLEAGYTNLQMFLSYRAKDEGGSTPEPPTPGGGTELLSKKGKMIGN